MHTPYARPASNSESLPISESAPSSESTLTSEPASESHPAARARSGFRWVSVVVGVACLGGSLFASQSGQAEIARSVGSDGVLELSNAGSKRPGVSKSSSKKRVRAVMPQATSASQKSSYDEYIREAARLYHLPEALIRAVIKVESNFDPRAVSPANAQGLMQMLPATAERMMVTDIFDPRQNILGGSRYLRVLANTFNGNLQLTIAGYNAGEGAVARYGGIPPYEETQNYVVKVLEYYQRYREQ